jgi:GntR family transcriptional regulator
MGAATDPVYLRVLEDLRAQIRDGVLEPGARVPSRNAIIARYGVGETAAKHALRVLATEGLIEAKAGSGSYVRTVPAACHLEHDRPHFPGSPFGLVEDRAVMSWEHQTRQVRPPRHVGRRLGLAEDDLVTMTRYLLTADGSPVQLATSYEPARLTTGSTVVFPEEGPLAGQGVAERMRAVGVLVDQVVEDISVRPCLSVEAVALEIPPGTPVLLVVRDHRAGDEVVETSEIVACADRFTLRYRTPLTPRSHGGGPVVSPAVTPVAVSAGRPA